MSRTRHSAKHEMRVARAQRARWTRILGLVGALIFVAALFWGLQLGPKIAGLFVVKPKGPLHYAHAPTMSIDVTKQYIATFKMAKGGQFVIELFAARAPVTVNNFVFLARNGFYDGVTFHRVIDGFMAQGGDPTGTGAGGPGYFIDNEDNGLLFDKAGVVAMANSGRNRNGSQFFITFGPQPNLNGGYTIFGQVTSGMDVVNGLTRRDPTQNPTFPGDKIQSVTITEQ